MTLQTLIKRNIKVYFKDKGVFFPSLITPLILLVLFVTFVLHFNYNYTYLTQNTAYSGIDFILFSNPKFLVENLIPYLGL